MITRRDFLKITAASGALASLGNMAEAQTTVRSAVPDSAYCYESSRQIPVIADVDLVVIGGSSRAVAAAVAAARTGCKVFLVAYMPYLGDDICGSFLYDLQKEEKPQTALARRLFEEVKTFRPLHYKTVLENELINHNVHFLYSSYATNVLTGDKGEPAGIALVNRSGRQAIRAKAIIDATHTASVARLLDIPVRNADKPATDYSFTVVGNRPKEADNLIRTESLAIPVFSKGKEYPVTRYTFRLQPKDTSYRALMEIEQTIRNQTWDPDQVDSSDLLWYIPEQTVTCRTSVKEADGYNNIRALPTEAFQCQSFANLWILGPCADLPKQTMQTWMRPAQALFLGELLGEVIGFETQKRAVPTSAKVYQKKVQATNYGQIGEILQPLRPLLQKEKIESPAGALPLLGEFDVVIMGGGTAGASAGISAARQGVRTLVLDYLHGLGGLGTLGLIGCYWDGFRGGFTATIDQGVHEMAPADHPRQEKDWKNRSVSDWKMEWYRRELLKAGGKVWFGVLGCGALVENHQVKGIVVATPFGRGVIRSQIVIDSTGSADIAIAAGAQFDYTGMKTLAVQGAGGGKRDPGDSYNNNDWLFIDDTDILDVSRTFIQSKIKMKGFYDIVKIPQTRERRRVIGEHIISVYDVLNHRRYPDTISFHQSSFDTHGMIVDPYFILSPPMKRHVIYDADVPLRSLLPKGLEGILTTGLGASAHRDAMPVIRMQPCLQNQGYAVGYLSAQCIKEHKALRKIDIKKIQKHLVQIGNLPERVLKDKEFKGFSRAEMKQAAQTVADNYKGLEILLTDPERCLTLIQKQFEQAQDANAKLIFASSLCILGDKNGSVTVSDSVKSHLKWDKGWHYTGMHQFGMSLSPLDALIMALGKTKEQSVLPVILEKAQLLAPEDYFSHFRAISMATEDIGCPKAVPQLAKMLTTPGVRFHAIRTYREAQSSVVPGDIDTSTRNLALKELHLARALYLCGDQNSIGQQVLEQYANGLQGHYARYAYEVLNSKSS